MNWYVLHTVDNITERELRDQVERSEAVSETYLPLRTKVRTTRNGRQEYLAPVMPSIVFVRASHSKLYAYLREYMIRGSFVLDSMRDVRNPMVIPDGEMERFRFLCDHYDQQIVYLRKSFSQFRDCDIVSVGSGLFQGLEGKMKEIKRDNKLIVTLGGFTIALSNIQKYKLTVKCPALKNPEQSMIYHLIDKCLAHYQSLGHVDDAHIHLRHVLTLLSHGADAEELFQGRSPEFLSDVVTLSQRIIIRQRGEQYDTQIPSSPLRPFLTIAPGPKRPKKGEQVSVAHDGFTEIIAGEQIAETVLVDEKSTKTKTVTNTYYSHVAITQDLVFTNWTQFYSHYKVLSPADKKDLHQKLQKYDSPLFLSVLTGTPSPELNPLGITFHPVSLGNENLIGLGLKTTDASIDTIRSIVNISKSLCDEIIHNTHLLPWRRFLSTVWLRV